MKLRSLAALAVSITEAASSGCGGCKCFPGDPCWPSDQEWHNLNSSVNGQLIKTIPLGTPCHDPGYSEDVCTSLQDRWTSPDIHMKTSSSIMAPWFANQSCDPFQPKSRPCELGTYVRYAVDVRSANDVVNAINFARNHDIRLVIRNTGHDYFGRSTGAGALAVWTHHLKDIDFLDWEQDGVYAGKAAKLGAGVQGFDALYAGHDAGYVLVTGECPTVGIAGAYTQGGGHSALSTNFGLSADNTLEFEVVTADGAVVKASRSENADLYWALGGGGGGNWGVVMSVTVKAHPGDITSGATLVFHNENGNTENFYKAIESFHSDLPGMVDAGATVIYYFSKSFFQIAPLTAFGKTKQDVEDMMRPFAQTLDSLDMAYNVSYTQFDSYLEHYDTYFGPLPVGNIQVGIAQYGGRLIPRQVVEQNHAALTQTAKQIVENNVTWIGVGTSVAPFGDATSNSLLPAWRDALVHATLTTAWDFEAPWEEMRDRQDLMTYDIMPAIEAITPNSGVYMNEADFRQPNFQEAFFGDKYEQLRAIKTKWDARGFFYAINAVSSEDWEVDNDGRMCRTA